MGHDVDDPSGKWAIQFGKTFQKKYADFLKISIEKVQNPLDVLVRLKKNWSKNALLLYKITTPLQKMENRLTVTRGFHNGDDMGQEKTTFDRKINVFVQ